jgi:hypothetical protein
MYVPTYICMYVCVYVSTQINENICTFIILKVKYFIRGIGQFCIVAFVKKL